MSTRDHVCNVCGEEWHCEGCFTKDEIRPCDEHLGSEYENMKNALLAIKNYVSDQAEDEGLWFDAETAPEAYLQSQLRALHELIERVGK